MLTYDYNFPKEDGIVFSLYDLATGDLSNLEIKKSQKGNCYIADNLGAFYSGFILNTKIDGTKSVCEISFHPSSKSGLYLPRLTFTKNKKDGSIKNSQNPEKVRIAFDGSGEGVDEFWKMINFLFRFKHLVDTGDFDDVYKAVNSRDVILKLKDLAEPERIKELIEYAIRSNVNIATFTQTAVLEERKNVIEVFGKLLNEVGYIEAYKIEKGISKQGEEVVWHFFLKNNTWLLGLNLDIRFIDDFVDEGSIGNPSTENQGNAKVDLIGLCDYTVLVELKTASTSLFTQVKTKDARTNTWSFTPEFIEGFSQCLAQKFEWDKTSEIKDLIRADEILSKNEYRTIDPKTVYIVGNKKKEIPKDSNNKDIINKRDTFERFRRNNRNIEIITSDELYERAKFIVYGAR